MVGQLISNRIDFFTPNVDWRLLSLLGIVATLGTLGLIAHAFRTWRGGRSLVSKVGTSVVAVAAAIVMAFAWATHLVTASVDY